MNYPLISEYVEAIKAAEDNFDQLKHLRPVLGEDGEPVMTSGNFAVVFKMKDEQTGKLHAVKCFLKEQEGRAEAYRQIAEELEFVSSTFLTPIKYLDKELFVDSANSEDSEFPVLLMDWVEGQTLDKYIREHIDDQYELSLLAYQFSRLAMWLMPQPFAHGDLKPDNILVKDDGTLVLVDYDGMYVPTMKSQKARELGSPDFRHPLRTEDDFDEHIDDFSLASILLSLKAIALQPNLLEEYGASDRLLFSEKDYRNLSKSSALGALQQLMQDAELASLYSLFILALSQNNLSQISFRLFNLAKPDKAQYEEENLSTEVTEEDLANAWVDEFGVYYTEDYSKLLGVRDKSLKDYHIKEGTIIICDWAFRGCSELVSITIPESVKHIGYRAFFECYSIEHLRIPKSVKTIKNAAFQDVVSLKTIILPSSIHTIGTELFAGCSSLVSFDIPESVVCIGDYAFYGCSSLSIVTIPKSVVAISDNAFSGCKCNFVCYSKNYKSNGMDLFTGDMKTLIHCSTSIIKYTIPDSVITIGSNAFAECISLSSIIIPNTVTSIKEWAFLACENLKTIDLPQSLIDIGECAFGGCSLLKTIIIPQNVTSIGKNAFEDCSSLTTVRFVKEVFSIGTYIFQFCPALKTIIIPIGKRAKFEEMLPEYKDKLVEKSNVVSITFDNSSTSKVDRCRVFKKDNDWKLEIVYKNGMKIASPHSLLQGNQSIVFDKQTIEKIQLYVGYCEGFYVNPKAVKVDFEYPAKYTAKILFDSDYIEINGITWGQNNNINEWKVKGIRSFNIEERLAVQRAEVVSSDYGCSVCFFMNGGGQTYIPLSKQSKLKVGDELDIKTAKFVTLGREGKDDIFRVME